MFHTPAGQLSAIPIASPSDSQTEAGPSPNTNAAPATPDSSGNCDLVVLSISHPRDSFAFPLARAGYESDIAAPAPASLAVLRADATEPADKATP
jgi:hypothetical protein